MSPAGTCPSRLPRGFAHAKRRMVEAFRRGRRLSRAFGRQANGVAIVEFALIVPFLFALYVGTAEFCRAMINSQALTRLARTVADLTALGDYTDKGVAVKQISDTTMSDIFSASKLVLQPFDSSTARIRVSAIGIYMNGTRRTVRVCSSAASNDTARGVGVAPADLVIPATYNAHGQRLVVAEVAMPYKPLMGKTFATLTKIEGDGAYPLAARFIWPVRGGVVVNGTGPEVVLPGGQDCPATSP